MQTELAIETKGLMMHYGHGPAVLDGVELRVPVGSVFALLGRNGTGKTTLIRLLMGLYRPSSGVARVLGHKSFPLPTDAKQRIGYLSQDQRMFQWMDLVELERFLAPWYPAWDHDYFEQLIDGLALARRRPIGHLSRGDQQKCGLLVALAQRPDLLILDEPAANLDTVLRREFIDSVLDLLTRDGMTVLISSHILPDIERLADHVAILDRGKIVLQDSLEVLQDSIKRLRFTFATDAPTYLSVPGAISEKRRDREILVTMQGYEPGLEQQCADAAGATAVEVIDLDLEDLFIEYVKQGVA